jgi:hypothetical protein
MTRRPALQRERDESGAVLILALLFTLIVGLAVGALATWSANDIVNIGNFKKDRGTLSAAEGAMQAQLSAMRYAYATTCPGTPYALDGVSIVVTCAATLNPASSASRVINFTASPQGLSSKVLITAQVTYDDFSSVFNKNDCLASTPSPTTCGSGMTVNSWVIASGG